jgi:hypothetical protein
MSVPGTEASTAPGAGTTGIHPTQELKRTQHLPNERVVGSIELAAARIRATLAKGAASNRAVALRTTPLIRHR